jgi:hypothetical protein
LDERAMAALGIATSSDPETIKVEIRAGAAGNT